MNTLHPKTNQPERAYHSALRNALPPIFRQRVPQVVLIVFLHVMPLCKVLYTASSALPSSPAAMVLRWAAAMAAMAGAFHTVSAASAAIVGLTKYTNNTPVGGPTNNAAVIEGGSFRFRITVSNAGSDHKKDYFNCLPMPPGLTMNTNTGGNGFITNSPNSSLVPGIYPVRLYAGNTSYPSPVTYNATITILAIAKPPTIVAQPASQSATEGQTITFDVAASGSAPLTYQWKFNSAPLPGETNSTLTLANVRISNSGLYGVTVNNAAGSTNSASAELVVQALAPLRLENPRRENNLFLFATSASNGISYVLWATVDFQNWTPIATNVASGGRVQFTDSAELREKRFYSVGSLPR